MSTFRFEGEPPLGGPKPNGHAGAGKPRCLETVWANDITVSLDTGGTIDGLAPRAGLVVLYGESGCGKTFVAVDLACHVAAGLSWRGMEVEQGVVIYVAAEAPESLKRRVWAWMRHHGVEDLPLLVVQSTVDLLNGDTDASVELVEKVTAEHGRVALVVIDTLARSMAGNENSPEDMGKYVASCACIREAGDTLTMVVHHTGKDLARGARGHSSLRAATDVELEVSKGEDGCGNVAVTKARDEVDQGRFGFRLEPVELGVNAKGRTVTTCVAVEAEATAKQESKSKKLTARQKVMLDCLATALADHGEPAPPAPDLPRGRVVVRLDKWVDVGLRYLPPDSLPPDAPEWRRRNWLKRTVADLQAKELVKHAGGWCWRSTSQSPDTSQDLPMGGSGGSPSPSRPPNNPIGLGGREVGRSPGREGAKPAKTTANCGACKELRPLDADRLCEDCRPKPESGRDAHASQDEAPASTRVWRASELSNGREWVEVPVLEVTADRVFVPVEWQLGREALKTRRKVQRMGLSREELETSGRTWFQYGCFYSDAGKAACEARTAPP